MSRQDESKVKLCLLGSIGWEVLVNQESIDSRDSLDIMWRSSCPRSEVKWFDGPSHAPVVQ